MHDVDGRIAGRISTIYVVLSTTGTYSVHPVDSTASTMQLEGALELGLKFFEVTANLRSAWEVSQYAK
jgi:hypothetical protein